MQRLVPEPEQCLALASIEGEFDAMVFNAVFAMLYGTGMLLRELLGLRLMDVLAGERTRIEIGGFRARTLPLPKGAADRLGGQATRPRRNRDLPVHAGCQGKTRNNRARARPTRVTARPKGANYQ